LVYDLNTEHHEQQLPVRRGQRARRRTRQAQDAPSIGWRRAE